MTLLEKNAKANPDKWYPKLVSTFIHEKYTPDDETALINNYLADPETYGEEYAEYQAYRKEVKDALKKAYKQ